MSPSFKAVRLRMNSAISPFLSSMLGGSQRKTTVVEDTTVAVKSSGGPVGTASDGVEDDKEEMTR